MPYRRLDVRIWIDEKIVDKPPLTKLTWIYTLTGLHTTSLPGLWIAGTESMAEGLRLDAPLVEGELRRLEDLQLIQRDAATRILRVPKCPKYNQAENERVVHAWFGHWQQLPESQLKRDHLVSLWVLGVKHKRPTEKLGRSVREAWAETFGRYLTQMQGQEGAALTFAFIEPERVEPEQLSLRLSATPQNNALNPPSEEAHQCVRESFAKDAPGPDPGSDPGSDQRGSSRTGESHLQEDAALVEAYVQGIRDATGKPFPRPAGDQVEALLTAANTYALDGDGRLLKGSERIAWVRRHVAEYRTATGGDGARYQRGFEPRSWLLWLQAGRPTYHGRGAQAPPRNVAGTPKQTRSPARSASRARRRSGRQGNKRPSPLQE